MRECNIPIVNTPGFFCLMNTYDPQVRRETRMIEEMDVLCIARGRCWRERNNAERKVRALAKIGVFWVVCVPRRAPLVSGASATRLGISCRPLLLSFGEAEELGRDRKGGGSAACITPDGDQSVFTPWGWMGRMQSHLSC